MRVAVPAAIAIMVAGSGWVAPAAASDWGCQVLLCLSNPGGPTQYAACVPPITKLWNQLATGHGFPACTEGGVSATKTHGKRGSSSYRVTMTYTDGSQQNYSLAGISSAPLLGNGGVQAGGVDLP
jgi:hypothetical protein